MSPDDGKVVKAVAVISSSGAMEEIVLEELDVFQVTAHADAVGAAGQSARLSLLQPPLMQIRTDKQEVTQKLTGSQPSPAAIPPLSRQSCDISA